MRRSGATEVNETERTEADTTTKRVPGTLEGQSYIEEKVHVGSRRYESRKYEAAYRDRASVGSQLTTEHVTAGNSDRVTRTTGTQLGLYIGHTSTNISRKGTMRLICTLRGLGSLDT